MGYRRHGPAPGPLLVLLALTSVGNGSARAQATDAGPGFGPDAGLMIDRGGAAAGDVGRAQDAPSASRDEPDRGGSSGDDGGATPRPPDKQKPTPKPTSEAVARPEAVNVLPGASSAKNPPPPTYATVVRGRRPPRSATDWTFHTGQRRAAPAAGATAADLLRSAPGVMLSQHSGQGKAHQIFLRGFDAVHGRDVEIHVGGIPVNEVSNVHGQGYADLHFLVPEAVSRVRVLEGAFDPRQGDFAVAGSVDFQLGLARRGLLASVSAGQHGLVRTLLGWGPEGQSEQTFVTAEFARGSGFGPNRTWRRGSALGQLKIPLPQRFKLRLLASTYAARFDAAGVLRLDDIRQNNVGFFHSYDDNQGGSSGRHQLLLELSHGSNGARAVLSTYVVLRDLRLRHNFTGATLEPNEKLAEQGQNRALGDLAEQQNDSLTLGGRGSYRRALSLLRRDHLLEVGVIWRHDRVEQVQQRLRQVDGQPWLDEVDADLAITDLGLYADLDLELWSWLTLRAGLRADMLSYRIEDNLADASHTPRREALGFHLGPKVTIEAKPATWLRLFASYGNGFRSPTALSLGQREDAPFTTVHAGELGGRLRLGPRLRATVAGFVTHVAQDIQFDHATSTTLYSGPTLRTGLSLLLESQVFSWLWASSSLTYAHARQQDTGLPVNYAPPLVVRLDLDARRAVTSLWGRPLELFGELELSLVGPRPLPYQETTATVALLGGALGVSLRPVTLSVEAFNLTDARWHDGEYVYASTFGATPSRVPARHVTAGRPFSVQGTVSLNF